MCKTKHPSQYAPKNVVSMTSQCYFMTMMSFHNNFVETSWASATVKIIININY